MTACMPTPSDPRGRPLRNDPRSTRGTAFAAEESAPVGFEGPLPAGVGSLEQQALRSYEHHRASSVIAAGSVAVSPQDADGAWLIVLEGEHDLSTAALLQQATVGLWHRCTVAVIDLSGADFIDTTVINWLMYAKRMLQASGSGALGIVEGPPASPAARLFRLLGLCDVVACFPTRQDALAGMRTGNSGAPG
jgi:anti-anti-sigma regulatory factor